MTSRADGSSGARRVTSSDAASTPRDDESCDEPQDPSSSQDAAGPPPAPQTTGRDSGRSRRQEREWARILWLSAARPDDGFWSAHPTAELT